MEWFNNLRVPLESIAASIVAAGTVAGAGVCFLRWVLRGEFATQAAHKKLAAQVETLDERLTAAESQLAHLPTQETVQSLTVTLAKMTERLEGLSEQIGGMKTQVNMLFKNEMSKGAK